MDEVAYTVMKLYKLGKLEYISLSHFKTPKAPAPSSSPRLIALCFHSSHSQEPLRGIQDEGIPRSDVVIIEIDRIESTRGREIVVGEIDQIVETVTVGAPEDVDLCIQEGKNRTGVEDNSSVG